jgi:hypothetical protein
MATIPPSLLPTSLSHLALVVYLMSLNPMPLSIFLFPRLLHPGFVLMYYFFLFFVFFLQFLLIFSASVSLPFIHCWAFLCPHRNELPPYSSLYGFNVHAIGFFPCISFCLYSVLLLFFSLYFVCYLLVIMLWLRWFDWIPFDPDLCVMDVYVTLAFGLRRKNGPDFCVVDKCVS